LILAWKSTMGLRSYIHQSKFISFELKLGGARKERKGLLEKV